MSDLNTTVVVVVGAVVVTFIILNVVVLGWRLNGVDEKIDQLQRRCDELERNERDYRRLIYAEKAFPNQTKGLK